MRVAVAGRSILPWRGQGQTNSCGDAPGMSAGPRLVWDHGRQPPTRQEKRMTTPQQPTPQERFERTVEGMRRLPPTGAVTFRGITSPQGTAAGVVVPQGITATSRDLVVATAGLTSPGIAVVFAHTGRDLAPVSAVQEAQEVALLPGTVLAVGRFIQVAGIAVEIIEELTRTGDEQWATSLTNDAIAKLGATVATTLANAQGVPCPVDVGYCRRFAAPLA